MSDSILEYSLTEVAAGIRRKEFSSEEVTRNCLEKIEKLQSKLNCFISIYLIFAIIDIYTRIKGGDFNDGCIL